MTVVQQPSMPGFTTDPPAVTALITCDGFATSIIDRKPSFTGVWDDLTVAAQFPYMHALTAIAVLAGVRERLEIQMTLAQLNDDLTETSTNFGAVSIVEPPPPPQIVQMVLVHTPHIFPTPGRYDLRVYANGALLWYKPVILRQGPIPQLGGNR